MFFRRKILCKEKLICMVQVVYVSINPWVIRHSAHLAMLSSKQDELRTEMRENSTSSASQEMGPPNLEDYVTGAIRLCH